MTLLDELTEKALALPVEERTELADRLWNSLDAAPITPIEWEWFEQARKRAEELDQGEVTCPPTEEVIAKIKRLARCSS